MNKKRLLKLADLLEADAANENGIKFDYCEWGFVENPKRPMSCGTTACAMGLAAISGAFRSAGLKWDRHMQLIEFKGQSGAIEAAEKLFDLSVDEACFLFTEADLGAKWFGAVAERKVAKLIRRFVAGKTAPEQHGSR